MVVEDEFDEWKEGKTEYGGEQVGGRSSLGRTSGDPTRRFGYPASI